MKYQDIQISDTSLKNTFVNAFINGDYQTALDIIDNSRQLDSKAFIAEIINNISEILSVLQSEADLNINIYLEELLSDFQNNIDKLINMQEYSATTTYSEFNFVYYNNFVYMHIGEDTNGILPTDTNYWVLIGLQGNKGALGTGLTVKYDWDNSVTYYKKDLVKYSDSLWVANSQNVNQVPSQDSQYWEQFVEFIKGKIESSEIAPVDRYVGQIWFKMNLV